MSHKLYTIGHSATQFPTFLAMLRRWEVSVLVDVRSKPQSLRFPHFDQVELERAVREEGISYVFLGEELGGRPEDRNLFPWVSNLFIFEKGVSSSLTGTPRTGCCRSNNGEQLPAIRFFPLTDNLL